MSTGTPVTLRTERNAPPRARSSALGVVAAVAPVVAVALAGIAAIWLIAVPVGPEACALTRPGPRNCFAHDRTVAAATATPVVAVVALALVAAVIATQTQPVGRALRILLRIAAPAVMLILAIGGYVSAAWIPALAWSTAR